MFAFIEKKHLNMFKNVLERISMKYPSHGVFFKYVEELVIIKYNAF